MSECESELQSNQKAKHILQVRSHFHPRYLVVEFCVVGCSERYQFAEQGEVSASLFLNHVCDWSVKELYILYYLQLQLTCKTVYQT